MLFKVYEALVGVHHLFEVYRGVHDMCERVTVIVVLIEFVECLDVEVTLHYYSGEYAACEASAVDET